MSLCTRKPWSPEVVNSRNGLVPKVQLQSGIVDKGLTYCVHYRPDVVQGSGNLEQGPSTPSLMGERCKLPGYQTW